jgi:hypothetical protein
MKTTKTRRRRRFLFSSSSSFLRGFIRKEAYMEKIMRRKPLQSVQMICALLLASSMIGWFCSLSRTIAQQAPEAKPEKVSVPFPVIPIIAGYEYVSHHFIQWLNDHPQYTRIEASVSDAKPPILCLVLTEKGGRRVNYSNSAAKVEALSRTGQEARLAKIEYRATNDFGQLPAHEFGFTDERGQAVRWRFTMAAPASERGSGLTPQETGRGWLLIYRDLGSAAGEGTAVQIGGKVSEAEPWTEISAPPYFVAYRGAYAEGQNIGIFMPGRQNWRVTAAPKELKEGEEWILTDERGGSRRLKITARRGDELTISGTLAPSNNLLTLQARQRGLALRSITLGSGAKMMRLSFTPDLDLSAAASSAFQVDFNGRNKILHGNVTIERKGDAAHLRWQPKSPDWAKSRIIDSTVVLNSNGYMIEVK